MSETLKRERIPEPESGACPGNYRRTQRAFYVLRDGGHDGLRLLLAVQLY